MKQTKICVICGEVFEKPYNCSRKEWKKRKTCSKKCGYVYRSKRNVIWNKGLTKETDKRVEKNAKALTGVKKDFSNYRGKNHHFWGTKHTEKWKKEARKRNSKEKHPNWQGGKTSLAMQIRNSPEYAEWRLKVYTRDNFTCQKCGCNKSGELEAHHIKFLFVIIKEYQIKTLDDALKCKELWEVKNGLTLCKDCHHKIKHLIK